MKKKTNKIYVLIVILFILFGLGEWKDRKDEEFRDCVIEVSSRENYSRALEYCENLD